MQGMVFAAGLGTRFKPWTDKHPKALAVVNGKSLLRRNIEYLRQYGISNVVVNVHHFADQIIEAIQQNKGWGSNITISDETDMVLETGGGIKVGELVGHDRLDRTIDIKKNAAQAELHPVSVFRTDVVGTTVQQEALLRFATAPDGAQCGADLLWRRAPRLRSGAFRQNAGETAGECAVRIATALDRTALAIQGPPGAGKTYVGAQMIRALDAGANEYIMKPFTAEVLREKLDLIGAIEG